MGREDGDISEGPINGRGREEMEENVPQQALHIRKRKGAPPNLIRAERKEGGNGNLLASGLPLQLSHPLPPVFPQLDIVLSSFRGEILQNTMLAPITVIIIPLFPVHLLTWSLR